MKDFLTFRDMVSPVLIELWWWLMVVAGVLLGAVQVATGEYAYAVVLMIVVPLATRVIAEVTIVVFRIYTTLREIADGLDGVRLDRSG